MHTLRPSKRCLYSISAFAISAVIIAIGRMLVEMHNIDSPFISSTLGTLWWIGFCLFILTAFIDWRRHQHLKALSAKRILPHYLAINREHKVTVTLSNRSNVDMTIDLIDTPPASTVTSAFPLYGTLNANSALMLDYTLIPQQRGDAYFGAAQILIPSQWRLWTFIKHIHCDNEIKVYPDFSIVNTTSLLSIEKNMLYMGTHLSQKLGSGTEFQQLREFRIGDTLKQIDWKATARLNKPISREYQEEKDQHIIFMLDCSRRMRTQHTQLSYFEYTLNALLVNSYIALDKGDAVGVMSFSGQSQWLAPIKGKANINQLLNHLYPITTSTDNSDYIHAAEALLQRHRKRSLIVLMTNLHEEDSDDIVLASQLLAKHHLVMVVCLQEQQLTHQEELPIEEHQDALLYAGMHLFANTRKALLERLKTQGVITVDATYQNMHMKLLHEYLQLKRSGRI